MRIYLAGPDVFLPDPMKAANAKKEICQKYGFIGMFPFDNNLNLTHLSPKEAGITIYKSNIQLMDSCDLIVANMTPFRGSSMDVGTAFEMGYMTAQGKPVFGYTNDGRLFADRIPQISADLDNWGMAIEHFDMVDNLMLEAAIIVNGGELRSEQIVPGNYYTELKVFEEVVKVAAKKLLA
ncbi:nucleoside 2-deoxyribosyltransferase [Phormidium sp. LEGE 05292]|uniref:nucleoside 2-deoxyribosyltransferase n=1 Tax=[Phormidium] sp. LEGE 05292 TaxID=767427 RepID=UPI0018829653|nr:nucleoside 2-deoxyribosyltransferase [Phormidium sp. LEGE 05292]MBE9226450.1 nucleoside 2-deoxyribosyltransferase [Phormidium sp. LEGE 05292]